ncbi:hypothetical protein Tco_1255854 [Tanacetum coccineum]
MDNLENSSDGPSSDETYYDDLTKKPKTTARKGLTKELLKWYDDTTDESIAKFKFAAKSKVPIRNCILSLGTAHTWSCIGNKTFGIRKPKDAIVVDQDRNGKGRLESRKSTMDISFTLGSSKEVDNLRILQSCNGLLMCSSLAWPGFDYIYNPSTNLIKRISQPENSYGDLRFYRSVVLRMTFDPRKSFDYKVEQARCTSSNIDT